jgi:hypothetical protein
MRVLTSTERPAQPATGRGSDDRDLGNRLLELRAVSIPEMPACEIRGHVAQMRAYLHDDVLRQAHHEELVLFPVLDRLNGGHAARIGSLLRAEHDTVREATAALDDLAGLPFTRAHVRRLEGLVEGIAVLIDGHLQHEEIVEECMHRTGMRPWNTSLSHPLHPGAQEGAAR